MICLPRLSSFTSSHCPDNGQSIRATDQNMDNGSLLARLPDATPDPAARAEHACWRHHEVLRTAMGKGCLGLGFESLQEKHPCPPLRPEHLTANGVRLCSSLPCRRVLRLASTGSRSTYSPTSRAATSALTCASTIGSVSDSQYTSIELVHNIDMYILQR